MENRRYLEFQKMDGWYNIYNKRNRKSFGYIRFDKKRKKWISVTSGDTYKYKSFQMCYKQIYEFLKELNKNKRKR